jgi:hypothetical protein
LQIAVPSKTVRALRTGHRADLEYPAAHRISADLSVETPDEFRRRLTESFDVALNQAAIDRDIFGRTDRRRPWRFAPACSAR